MRTKRLDGATWGLIAQARDLGADHVRAAADRALALRQQQEAEGTATPAIPPTAEPPVTDPDVGSDPQPGTDAPGTPEDPDAGGGDEDDGSSPEPSDEGTVGGIVDDTGVTDVLPEPLDDTVDDTVDVVDDVLDGTTGAVDETTDAVDETTDTVEDTLGGLLGGD